jgi:hypothetical protein
MFQFRDVDFAGGIGEPLKNLFGGEAEREPRFGRGHEAGAKARFRRVAQWPDVQVVHAENLAKKLQARSSEKTPSTYIQAPEKHQASSSKKWASGFGNWSLEFLWMLELDAWSFPGRFFSRLEF